VVDLQQRPARTSGLDARVDVVVGWPVDEHLHRPRRRQGAQLFEGDPSTIVLKNHEIITIEISRRRSLAAFDWKSAANSGL